MQAVYITDKLIRMMVFIIVLSGCDASLSDKDRTALREEMKDRKIRKVSEEEIYSATLKQGQRYGAEPANDLKNCHCIAKKIDSLSSNLSAEEQALWEAYSSGNFGQDNVQKAGPDSLIYTSPLMTDDQVTGIYFIKFSRKHIVLGLD